MSSLCSRLESSVENMCQITGLDTIDSIPAFQAERQRKRVIIALWFASDMTDSEPITLPLISISEFFTCLTFLV